MRISINEYLNLLELLNYIRILNNIPEFLKEQNFIVINFIF